MEFVAWATHKYLMHGFLWFLHSDHHSKDSYGFFEKNDFFFLIFAIPGILLLFFGMNGGYNFMFFAGLGITLYGLAYFLIHEIFIHRRFKFFRDTDIAYFKAVRKAHKLHHKHLEKENGDFFGMLWVPFDLIRKTSSRS
jgi:beta-carotene 3-hydroxylase